MRGRRVRLVQALALLILASLGGAWIGGWYITRLLCRQEAAYFAKCERLELDHQRRCRDLLATLGASRGPDADGPDLVDNAFDLLQVSSVATRSDVVAAWREAPPSEERRRVALAWVGFAAEEAAFHAELNRRWRIDLERGRRPHHISTNELPPPRPPALAGP